MSEMIFKETKIEILFIYKGVARREGDKRKF